MRRRKCDDSKQQHTDVPVVSQSRLWRSGIQSMNRMAFNHGTLHVISSRWRRASGVVQSVGQGEELLSKSMYATGQSCNIFSWLDWRPSHQVAVSA